MMFSKSLSNHVLQVDMSVLTGVLCVHNSSSWDLLMTSVIERDVTTHETWCTIALTWYMLKWVRQRKHTTKLLSNVFGHHVPQEQLQCIWSLQLCKDNGWVLYKRSPQFVFLWCSWRALWVFNWVELWWLWRPKCDSHNFHAQQIFQGFASLLGQKNPCYNC